MGTNYYLREDACPHCGRSDGEVHIGKSSAGWCFALHVAREGNELDPIAGIRDLPDWVERLSKPGAVIVDEYGSRVSLSEMLDRITERRWNFTQGAGVPFGYRDWKHFHEQNHSEVGPHGLLRHRIGSGCVGHGAGTWDLVVGEFS